MSRITLTLISLTALALGACSGGTADSLSDGRTSQSGFDPNGTAGGENATFNHSNDPGAPGTTTELADPGQVRLLGSPEVASRLHSCGKLSVRSLGALLTSRGLTGSGARPAGAPSGRSIFDQGGTAAVFGGANYKGRAPEAPFATTSATSKMFDILTMASYDAVTANWNAPACPGVKVIGVDGKFTHDGLTCLMGKPATAEHEAIANDAIAKNPTDGAKIAVAALLSAAHTCQ